MIKRIVKNVSMYPAEIALVERYAKVLNPNRPNFSATLGIIIREWRVAEGSKLAEMERTAVDTEATDD